MELKLKKQNGEAAGVVEVSAKAYDEPFRETLIHQAVTAYMAGGRAGTKSQKTRSEVSGGGKKPWRQKGTGNARAGTSRSPIWRGGGVTFAGKPRNHAQKLNRKMYRTAMRSIVSELVRQDRLTAVETFEVDSPKTKQLKQRLEVFGLSNVLIVTEQPDQNLYFAARNMPGVGVIAAEKIDPVSLVSAEHVLITAEALRRVEGWLS
ncbi:50S ribosomal protein L4 [Halorhodospira halochloris]|uniref:50S ribosomal protein L4 n=1 Tax=Halorhodospira halochloris TaxID=1052 RepID=UPI001EE8475D|nr:50S ribosomal protein L4 [Halorhodospira halochloris]MCG5530825.1 50S ribosomal protein L4 [Halorhodospira halochloris]